MRISIRANIKDVGYGHVKRCLSVAEEFASRGYQTDFYVDDNTISNIFPSACVRYICIDSEQQFLQHLKSNKANILILDGYFADENYIKCLKSFLQMTFIVLLDSLKSGLMNADILVNPGLYAHQFYNQEKEKKEKFLLGSEYTILGREYTEPSAYQIGEVQSILITMGGMDFRNITSNLLPNLLLKYPTILFYVVVGKYFSSTSLLLEMSKKHANLILLQNLSSLKEFILKSDICISAAGTTVFEIARCGRPIILFAQEENQLFSSHYWEETNGVLNLGYFEERMLPQYIDQINKLIQNNEKRKVMSESLLKNSIYGTSILAKDILEKFYDWKMVKINEDK